ncbi:MAG: hypothetical protein JO272_01565 [Pseudonocardiales bacterium]|nr:hypothetical protein [Pseudonocardiales bacterium]
MTLFHQDSEPPRLVTFPNFLRRRWIVCSLVVILLVGIGYFVVGRLSQKCGPGMTATGSPYVCVGLDVDSTALRDADPLADLENTLAEHNRTISGPFATIVLLEQFTPDPRSDSVTLHSLRHEIEGAITAVSRANGAKTGATPKIKLLLANHGLQAEAWRQAVDAIKQARLSEHIVAVIGIGESWEVGRRRESHPPPLAEPCVKVALHTAPTVEPVGIAPCRQ